MNNEPVAWINKDEYHGWLNWDKNTEMPINIPLYTHPVSQYKAITNTKIEPTVVSYTHPVKEQGNPVAWRSQAPDGYWSVYQSPVEGAEPLYTGFKELTDEEIEQIADDHIDWVYETGFIEFARAILRKAQEK